MFAFTQLDKKKEVSEQKTRKQIDTMLPENLRKLAHETLNVCKDVQKKYKDHCDKTFFTVKCLYEYSPGNFFYPWKLLSYIKTRINKQKTETDKKVLSSIYKNRPYHRFWLKLTDLFSMISPLELWARRYRFASAISLQPVVSFWFLFVSFFLNKFYPHRREFSPTLCSKQISNEGK